MLLLCFYLVPSFAFGQNSEIMSNKSIFEKFVDKKSSQIIIDLSLGAMSFKPVISGDQPENIVYTVLIKKGVVFNDSSLHHIRIFPKISSSITWSGNAEKYNREIVMSLSVQIHENEKVVDSRSYFEVYTDEIFRSDIEIVQSSEFMFANDVDNEKEKNVRKRILEPSVVLIGIMSTAYILFTLRL